MKEAFENILERLEERCKPLGIGLCPDWKYIRDIEAKEIVKGVAEEYNNGWIPCSDRLPKYDEEYFEKHNNHRQYIVMCNGAYEPTVAYFSKEKEWYYNDFVKFNDVIAWQPLPEPYKESEDK